MLTRIGALLIGLALILQPLAGIPAAQAARSAQDILAADPVFSDELNQRPQERRYDDAQSHLGALSHAPAPIPNVEVEAVLASAAQVAAGYEHTCALTSAGGVKCWGDNYYGQLGDGTTTTRLTPVDVVGLESGVAAIATGAFHTCARTSAGGVKCWGNNDRGQLGDGTTTTRLTPVDVVGLTSGMAAVAPGYRNHTCALTSAGGVKCWGANSGGQLGDGTTAARLTPVDVVGLASGVKAISTGGAALPAGGADFEAHTCAVTVDGGIKCWGNNDYGQLGDGTTTARHTPVNVFGLGTGMASVASARENHTCALTSAGGVKCWGRNGDGQLGDGTGMDRHTPVDVIGLGSGVAAIAAGWRYTCALTTGGGVKCWGNNGRGRDGTTTGRYTPADVVGLAGVVTGVAAGHGHTCALTSTGGVKCWGINYSGQLGDGTTTDWYTPADVVGLASGVAAAAAGRGYTCALMTGGGVKCWGDNYYGQLGDGGTADRRRYTPADVVGLGSGMAAVATGEYHACALTTSGGIKCWGNNGHGQVGDGMTVPRYTPADVVGLASGVAAVAAGYQHTCALTRAGGVKCWGRNSSGQLGDGTTTARYTPVDIVGLGSRMAAIAAGQDHTCALTTAGGVKCWGRNSSGQLGDGTTTARLTPVDVIGLASGVAAIAAGQDHTCALTTSGGVKCWGDNRYSQLGDGTWTSRRTPVDALGLGSGVAVIAAGAAYTCALTTGGGVKCWGQNNNGQLGDGTTTDRYAPADVVGLGSGVAVVATGIGYLYDGHTCALTAAGGVKCWGRNGTGQLGVNPGWTPVDVIGFGEERPYHQTDVVSIWLTTADGTKRLERQPAVYFAPDSGVSDITVDVDEQRPYQEIDGFGAAMTDSSAWLIRNQLSDSEREKLMRKLFDPNAGIGLSFVRVPMGSSDFAKSDYTYDDNDGVPDPELAHFSVEHDTHDIIPLLQEAKRINPHLKLMGSPWSAPAWMKTSNSLNGGQLKREYYAAYAQYFVRFVQSYRSYGLPIYAVTVQNEPHHEFPGYPTMGFPADAVVTFIKDYLGPALAAENVKIVVWDHNWDEPEYPKTVLNDAEARIYVSGSAFHCYNSENVKAQSEVYEAHKDKEIYFTECSGHGENPDFGYDLWWTTHYLTIGATRNWARTVLRWNLVLDSKHGPVNPTGQCQDCLGLATIVLKEPVDPDERVKLEADYWALGHASKFVVPGAHRIESSGFKNGIENVAFKNPDGSKVVLVINTADTAEQSFKVRAAGKSFTYTLPAGAVATFKWGEGAIFLPLVVRG